MYTYMSVYEYLCVYLYVHKRAYDMYVCQSVCDCRSRINILGKGLTPGPRIVEVG